MAVFLRRLAVFLGVGCLLFLGIDRAIEASSPSFALAKERLEHLLELGDSVDALVIGNSHAGSLDVASMGYEGYYLHRGGSDAFDAYLAASGVVPELDGLSVVFLPLSYHTFHLDNAMPPPKGMGNRDRLRRESYATYRSFSWLDGELGTWLSGRLSNLIRPDHGEALVLAPWLEALAAPESELLDDGRIIEVQEIAELGAERSSRLDHARPELSREHCDKRIELQMRLVNNCRRRRPDVDAAVEERLNDLCRLLGERGVRLVLFTPPYYAPYNEGFDPELRSALPERGARLADAYEHVVYFDHSAHPEFTNTGPYFRNVDHLNTIGAREYGQVLAEELANLGN